MAEASPLYRALDRMREDAMRRGFDVLAIAYGCSLIRLNVEEIDRRITEILRTSPPRE